METTEKYFIIAILVIINKEIAKLIMLKNDLLQINDIYDVRQTLSQAPKQISRKYYIWLLQYLVETLCVQEIAILL